MALIYMDGFDAYPTADISKRWTVSNGTWTVDSTGGRNSTGAMKNDQMQDRRIWRTLGASYSALIYGFAVKLDTAITSGQYCRVAQFIGGGLPGVQIGISAGGTIEVRPPSSSNVNNNGGTALLTYAAGVAANAYYFLELKITFSATAAANSLVLYLNGTQVAINSGGTADTRFNGGGTASDQIEIGGNNGAPASIVGRWDDLYLIDPNSGTTNLAPLGDIRVECIRGTGAGTTTTWTPDTGSNYARVNETSEDGDTSYIKSANVGDIDTFAMADLSSTPSSIKAIQFQIIARKDDAGARTIASAIRSGGANYDNSGTRTYSLSDNYTVFLDQWEKDPATNAAWTGSGVNAMEAGVKLVG